MKQGSEIQELRSALEEAQIRLAHVEAQGNLPRRRGRKAAPATEAAPDAPHALWLLEKMELVQTRTKTAVTWKEFDATSYVPSGAKAVLLQLEVASDTSDVNVSRVLGRPSAAGPEYKLAMVRGGTGDNIGFATQATLPLKLEGGRLTFEHSQNAFPGTHSEVGCEIWLLGFYA